MKKTTVQWFCDKCNSEMKASPDRSIYIDNMGESARVSVEYYRTAVCEYENSMLCDECKKELLEEALKRLKRKK
jgi:hypothetical protein